MVQSGEATSWWGATYYWVFRLFTFNGQEIFLLSLIGLMFLTLSLVFFVNSLGLQIRVAKRIVTILMATPIYGVFGVSVSHDVFQVSGLLLFSGLLLRVSLRQDITPFQVLVVAIVASVGLLMTQTGIVIAGFAVILLVPILRFRSLLVFAWIIFIYIGSNFGFPKAESSLSHVSTTIPRILLADLKCVVQHPDVLLTDAEWQVLEGYAARDVWKDPVPCSNPDVLTLPLGLNSLLARDRPLEVTKPLLRTYWSVVGREPAIVVMSHIQRSRVALPPPFFQPPSNQVSWNVDKPIGIGTNTAIQDGPELLHPSIDESSVRIEVSAFKPLEVVAQGLTFFVNQASWFWGWGGLWLYPILFFYAYRLEIRDWITLLKTLSPTLLLHSSIFLIGPSSLGRYVMSTVFMGIACFLATFSKKNQSHA